MAKVERLQALLIVLRKKRKRIKDVTVEVGYTQNYAIYVHENLEALHAVGQAKFLEEPARDLAPDIPDMVARAMQKRASFQQALLLVGLRLQRESQQLVPVDTGALKASAFTRVGK